VPRPALRIALVTLMSFHIAQNLVWTPHQVGAGAVASPPPRFLADLASLGERQAASGLLAIHLQSVDSQAGASTRFSELDYPRLLEWLSLLIGLEPGGAYPLLLASQVYAQSADPAQRRMMLDFVYERFFEDPERRWPWLAHAAIMAKHRLHDLPMALKYARAVSDHARSAPGWARQMPAFILEEMGELESARVMLGALLAENAIQDPHERRFLLQRLQEMTVTHGDKSSYTTKPEHSAAPNQGTPLQSDRVP
jgi:hypothetical protein